MGESRPTRSNLCLAVGAAATIFGRQTWLAACQVAVADGKALLISSANLTEYAMTLNMELGVPIRGGELPSRVEQHFERLIQTGVLSRSKSVLQNRLGAK